MKKENLYNLSEYFTKENDSFAENLRYNLDICLKHSDITIHGLAESAGISFDTLKNLLYQNSKDCKLSTAALLAKAIGVTVDELIGLDTISEEDMDCITCFGKCQDTTSILSVGSSAGNMSFFWAVSGKEERPSL